MRVGSTAKEQEKCTHPSIRKVVLEGGGWEGEECLVAHYFDSGALKPGCWDCPECGKYVSYEERLDIYSESLKERST